MTPLHPASRDFLGHFVRGFPGRSAAMVGLLILAGLAEGVGLLALLPLLEVTLDGEAAAPGQRGPLGRWVHAGFAAVGSVPTLPGLLAFIVAAMAAKGLLVWVAMRQVGFTVARVAAELRLDLIRALLDARCGHLLLRRGGHVVNAVSMEAQNTGWAYKDACRAAAGLVQVAVYLAVAVLVDPLLAGAALLTGAAVLLATRGFLSASRRAGVDQVRTMKELTARLGELLPGIKAVKAMAREDEFRALLEAEAEGFELAQRRKVLAEETLGAFREPVFVAVVAVGLLVAIRFLGLPLATVAALAVLFYKVLFTAGDLQSRYQTMTVGEAAFASIRTLTAEARADAERLGGGATPPPLGRGLALDGVSVAYGGHRVLDQASLSFPAGSFTTLVGPSGSGKTTTLDLLTGLVEPAAGAVRVDGVPLTELDLRAWRSRVGYVPQEPLLFHDTVARNVTLGRPGVPDEEVRAALAAADALGFVEDDPAGIHRVIGERGTGLSGGQRQRIAIARALLGKPRLLILDEATTALDPASEAAVCETLKKLAGGREITLVAVSHQAALREAADRVVEVAGGGTRLLRGGDPAEEAPALKDAPADTPRPDPKR